MRELELKEKKIKEIQSTGDRLLREDHPARPTVEVRGACRDPSRRPWGEGQGWGPTWSPLVGAGLEGPWLVGRGPGAPQPRRQAGPDGHMLCGSPSRQPCRPSGAGCCSCAVASRLT